MIFIIIILSLYVKSICYSGIIYGTIKYENSFLKEGFKVIIKGKEKYKGITKINGTFNINVKELGKVYFHINYNNINLIFTMFSMKKANRYDLIIEKNKKSYIIKRI